MQEPSTASKLLAFVDPKLPTLKTCPKSWKELQCTNSLGLSNCHELSFELGIEVV